MSGNGAVYTETVIYSAPEAFAARRALSDGDRDARRRRPRHRPDFGRPRRDRRPGRSRSRPRDGVPVFQESVSSMKLAERMSRIGVESAFDVLVRARALEAKGQSVVHLEIGEPDFPTPRHIVEAAKTGARRGLDALRPDAGPSRTAGGDRRVHVSRTRGIEVGPEHVSVVPGGKPIIFFPMLALLEPGDEVIYPNPGFPIYESMIRFLGRDAVPMPLRGEPRLLVRSRPVPGPADGPHEDADAEFAAESDRRRDSRARTESDGRHAARSRPDRAHRRDLLAHLSTASRRCPSRASRACWRRPSSWTAFRRPTP